MAVLALHRKELYFKMTNNPFRTPQRNINLDVFLGQTQPAWCGTRTSHLPLNHQAFYPHMTESLHRWDVTCYMWPGCPPQLPGFSSEAVWQSGCVASADWLTWARLTAVLSAALAEGASDWRWNTAAAHPGLIQQILWEGNGGAGWQTLDFHLDLLLM